MVTSFKQSLSYSSRSNPCPVCGKDHGCKVSDEFVICLRGDRDWNVPGWKWVKEAQNGMGGVFVADDGSESTFDREEWLRKKAAEKEAERKRKSSSLSEEQRDRNARQIIRQLGLSTADRQDLHRRGLTDEEIAEIGFVSASKSQHLIVPVSPDFPAANSKGNKLNIGGGMLVPVFDVQQQIIGFQIKTKRKDAKYVWLSQDSDFRLPNGEPPLTIRVVPGCKTLRITEGTFKPLIASLKHNQTVLGAGGHTWASSPKQLKYIIDTLKPEQVILEPDAGWKVNDNVKAAYNQLAELLDSFGEQLYYEDWGQGDSKSHPDYDELVGSEKVELRLWKCTSKEPSNKQISEKEWWKRFGLPNQFKKFTDFVAKSVKKVQAKGSKKSEPIEIKPAEHLNFFIDYKPGELIDPIEWERVGCPPIRVADEFDEDFSREAIALGYKHIHNGKGAGTGKSHKAGLMSLESLGLETPVDEEGNENAELKPTIFYHAANSLNPTTATVEENFVPLPARSAGYVKDESRLTALGNPYLVHVKPGERPDIEGNCRDAESFFYSYEQGRAIHGGKESPLCETCPEYMEDDRVVCPLLLSKRDVLKKEERIRVNLNAMVKPKPIDIGVLDEATAILEPTRNKQITPGKIQATIGKLSIKEENNKFLKLIKSLLVNTFNEIEEFDPENKLYGANHVEVVESLLLKRVEIEAIDPAPDEWKPIPRYDLPCLPTGRSEAQEEEKQSVIPSEESIKFKLLKLKLHKAKIRFEDYIWKLYGEDFLNNNSWGIPLWNPAFIDGEEINTFVGWRFSAPSVEEVIAECDRLIGHYKIPSLATPKERLKALQDQLLPDWVPGLLKILSGDRHYSLRLNGDFLTVTEPNRRNEMVVKAYDTTFYLDATAIPEDLETMIRLTKRDNAVKINSLEAEKEAQIGIKEFGEKHDSKLFKKASDRIEEIDEEIHRLKLDSANRNILHVVGEEIDYGHLDIKFVRGIGKLGKQRYSKKGDSKEFNFDSKFASGNRVGYLAKAICESDPTKRTGLIDHACFVDTDSKFVNPTYLELKKSGQVEVLGAHFREGRGSNLFIDCDRIFKIGKAIKNLGELAAQWQAITGEIVDPARLTGRFGEWVARQVVAEDIQEIGRLRANRRKGKRLEVYMLGEYSEEEIQAIANYYTGANIEIIEASDICIEAASKRTQTAYHLVAAIRNLLDSGDKLTTTKVGEMIGVSQGRVSQLCKELYGTTFKGLKKLLTCLIDTSLSETNSVDLSEEELNIASEFLPNLVADWQKGDITASQVVEDVVCVAQAFGQSAFQRIVAGTPPPIIAQLVKAILHLVPIPQLQNNSKLIAILE